MKIASLAVRLQSTVEFLLPALCLLSILGMLICDSVNAATEFPPHGGQGDVDVKDNCPPGQFLVGLSVRSGAIIDQMALTCAGVDTNTGATGPANDILPPSGGNGGNPSSKTCLPGFIIHGVAILMAAQDQQVRLFIFDCVSTTSTVVDPNSGKLATDRHNLDIGNNAPVFPEVQQACPAGEAVVGIHIRYGLYVNAVGLICNSFQRIVMSSLDTPEDCSAEGDQVPKEWGDMLNVHNEKRQLHCVPPLKWCESLAISAQTYANECILNARGASGENMADHWRTDANGNPILPALSDRDAFEKTWYCEIDNYDFNNPVFKGGFTSNCQNVNGHFTQVVWKDTAFLGCGRATCEIGGHTGTHWVCRYQPPGNVNVDSPFVLAQQVLPKKPECP
jgi:uncharacterized protein YkwD